MFGKRSILVSVFLVFALSFLYSASTKNITYIYKATENSRSYERDGYDEEENRYVEGGQLNISFSLPVFKLSDIDTMTNDIQKLIKLKISPSVQGDFKPIGTRQVAFIYRQKLKPSTRYTVSINAQDIKSTDGEEVNIMMNNTSLENNQYSFTTKRLQVRHCQVLGENLNDPLFITFNHPVDYHNLKLNMKIKAGMFGNLDFGAFPVLFTNIIQSNGNTYGFIYTNYNTIKILTSQKKPDTEYTVQIDDKLLPINGELGMENNYQYSFHTYAPLKFLKLASNNYGRNNQDQFYADSTLYFQFNNTLDKNVNLKYLISTEPPVKNLSCQYYENSIGVTGDFTGGIEYKIRILSGIKDVYGQLLHTSVEEKASIEHAVTILGMPSGYMVMENYIPMILPFKIRNLDQVNLYYRTFQTKEDIARFILQKQEDTEFKNGAQLKEIKVKEEWDKFFNYRLDLARLIKTRPAFMAYLATADKKISRNDNNDISRAGMVLFTDMGMTVKSGPESSLVYLRGLKDNLPVSGANVYEIKDNGGSGPDFEFKGRTDSQGLCSFKGSYPMPFIIVEKDGKFCINYGRNKYSYDYDYESSEYSVDFNSLFYDNKEKKSIINYADNRSCYRENAMLFTDRFLYKPGEKSPAERHYPLPVG